MQRVGVSGSSTPAEAGICTAVGVFGGAVREGELSGMPDVPGTFPDDLMHAGAEN